jgi:hypothetical protein
MQLFGTRIGTAVWLTIGISTAILAVYWADQITAIIGIGWIMLAVFSYLEHQKESKGS